MGSLNNWLTKKATPPEVAAPMPELVEAPAANPFAKRFNIAKPVVESPVATVVPVAELDVAEMDLESLGAMDVGEAEPIRETRSQFSDETPATQPMRELPPDLDKNQLNFVQLIDGVYAIIDDAELLGTVIRSIMIELKAYPQYIKLVAKDDVRAWVKAMRDSMGLARIKKQEVKTKRASGPAAAKKQKQQDSDLLQAAEDLGIDWGNV